MAHATNRRRFKRRPDHKKTRRCPLFKTNATQAARGTRHAARGHFQVSPTRVEHMRANERNGVSQMQVARFAGKFVDRSAREFYDVAVAKGAKGGEELLRGAD